MTQMISFADADPLLNWLDLTDALAAGHELPRAEIKDVFLYRDENTLLNRSAWIKGLGLAVKCATIFPKNADRGRTMIGGAVNLFSDEDGALNAILDFALVTKWKTAGDSLLAARRLARPDSRKILIIGAGTVGHSLLDAYRAGFPDATFTIWNRSPAGAERFREIHPEVSLADDLEAAVKAADIVISATMSTEPILMGAWFQPGQHIDLIGAYRPDMREADDDAVKRAQIFVDSRATTIGHIGELRRPIEAGIIQPTDIVADYYDIGKMVRRNDDDITLFKNGGGAHLDLMTSIYIQKVCAGT